MKVLAIAILLVFLLFLVLAVLVLFLILTSNGPLNAHEKSLPTRNIKLPKESVR
jgi:hypothetical protein